MVAFDYGNKQVKISKPYFTTDNRDADYQLYESFYQGVIGKVAKNSF
jgi:hypothetical protein